MMLPLADRKGMGEASRLKFFRFDESVGIRKWPVAQESRIANFKWAGLQ